MNKMSEALKRVFNSRSLKYGSNSIILIAVVIAIAVFVNILVGMAGLKWDLTANKLYSIGDTTKDILKGLNKDIRIIGLFDGEKAKSDSELNEVMELLAQYTKYPHVKVEYVDPDKKTDLIKQLDPDNLKELQGGDFVVQSGNKIKKLERGDLFSTEFDQQTFSQYKTGSNAEQSFTGAVKYVTSESTPSIYFTEGHDEKKVGSDFTVIKDVLEKNNYEVKTINLLSEAKVPEDAELLLVPSPKKDLTADEKDKLAQYLKDGGKAIFLFDALIADTSFAQFEEVLKDYNVSLNYDRVKEELGGKRHLPPDKVYDILPETQSNSITSNLGSNFTMLMSGSRSINTLKNQKEYITVTSLLKSSDKSVGEQIDKARGKDNAGPLDLALAVENKGGAKVSKVLVVGNSAFISDATIQQYGLNGFYFLMNSMNWMLDKKDDVVIAPKSYAPPRLDKLDALSANLTALFVVILLPLVIFGFGTYVWVRRRHL